MKYLFTLIFCALSIHTYAQDAKNVELVSHIQFSENLNDVWGYTAPDGTEYALVGSTEGTYIFDLSNPSKPVEAAYVGGASSIWRDIKVWDHYAYVTNESSGGLLIIDLEQLPDTVTYKRWTGSASVSFTSAHNVFIDEKGYAYIIGANYSRGGAIIADVHTDPWNPQVLTVYDEGYIHDLFVRGDTMWAAEIYNGYFSVVDVSDKSPDFIPASKIMATRLTPNTFTHNVWVSPDNRTIVTTDEVSDGKVAAYDVSDLSNIEELDLYRSNAGSSSIPHNAFFDGNYVAVSWYRDGIRILDAAKPGTLVEVGFYDTTPLSGGGFNGVWGIYPYFASGLYLASDIEGGLFVLRPTLVRAAYLEGIVRDKSQNRLGNVKVELLGPQNTTEYSDGFGNYNTGVADPGIYSVKFSKAGYASRVIKSVQLTSGQTTTLNVELEALPSYSVSGTVIEMGTGTPIPFARVLAKNEESEFEVLADASGAFTFNSLYQDTFTFYAGHWGHRENDGLEVYIGSAGVSPQIELARGYYDDFLFDLGWSVSGDAGTGIWVRDIPVGTEFSGFQFNPDRDDFDDLGEKAYITGNGGGSAGSDDVDNGYTLLTSPYIHVSSYNEPILKFKKWYMTGGGGGNVNDSLKVFLHNGQETVLVDLTSPADIAPFWNPVSLIISDFWDISDSFQLQIQASDFAPGHLIEAGLDVFEIIEGSGVAPVAYFHMDSLLGCAPYEFTPVDSSSGQIDQWIWIVSGTANDTFYGKSALIRLTEAGSYDLKLITTNVFGQSEYSEQGIIEVYESPLLSTASTPAHAGQNDGKAFVTASGGMPPYSYQWSDPAGQNSDTAVQLAPGSYRVTVVDSRGCSSIDTVEVGLSTGIGNTGLRIGIYPNPFSDRIQIEASSAIERAELRDATGRLLLSEWIYARSTTLKLDEKLPRGIYLLRLYPQNGDLIERKLVKQ